jgi:recombinational DNA repair protein RecR
MLITIVHYCVTCSDMTQTEGLICRDMTQTEGLVTIVISPTPHIIMTM